MTSIRMSLTASLVFLLFISNVVAQDDWDVKYNPTSLCALQGASVSMICDYKHPSGHSVKKVFWSKELVTPDSEPPDLVSDPDYKERVQYVGVKQHLCSFRLKNLRKKDQTKYYFTFITDPGGSYQGKGGVHLSVTDLNVEGPEKVIEGVDVTLTCKTTCSLTVRPTFTWYKDGHPLSSSTDQLHLHQVKQEDTGKYHCSVLGQNSPDHTLSVKPPPYVIIVIAVTGVFIFILSVGYCVWKKGFLDTCRGTTPNPDPSMLEQCSPESEKLQERSEACSDKL